MDKVNENEISTITWKLGKLVILSIFVQIGCAIFLINPLVELFLRSEYLRQYDPLSIDRIIRSSTFTWSLILIGKYVFKFKIKDMFKNKEEVYRLSLKAKMKITILFTSIGLFSLIVSGLFMTFYSKSIMPLSSPESNIYLLVFSVFIAPITEEIVFRGVILKEFQSIGNLFAITISSVGFGMMHGIGFIHATIFGFISGTAYVLTGNIVWSILLHFLHNIRGRIIEHLILVLFPGFHPYIGLLIISILLLLLYLLITRKDEEISKLGEKINITKIIQRFKRDKRKYSIFINQPEITISISIVIFIQLISIFMK